jgi:ABC-type phosphate transport system substrate-binding protein
MSPRVLLLALAVSAAAPALGDDGFVVIVHPSTSVAELSRRDVSGLFLKRVSHWPSGAEVAAVEPPERSPARDRFCRVVHGKSVAAVKAHWNRMIFAGREVPPIEKDSDAEVVAFVQRTPGAIGYVAAATPVPGVKIVKVGE